MHHDKLENWERWPIWALGLSNGLNISLWYILSFARIQAAELPIRVLGYLQSALPLIVVIGGISAAVSLDGVLIATIAGMRHGRRGYWSVLTIIGAALFSGAIAYAVHSGWLDQAPGLHVAQAVVLALYNLHLSQAKKTLQPEKQLQATVSSDTKQETAIVVSPVNEHELLLDAVKCRSCGELFENALAVKKHRREGCPERFSSGK